MGCVSFATGLKKKKNDTDHTLLAQPWCSYDLHALFGELFVYDPWLSHAFRTLKYLNSYAVIHFLFPVVECV